MPKSVSICNFLHLQPSQTMAISEKIRKWVTLLYLILCYKPLSALAVCDLSVPYGNDLYDFNLIRSIEKHPHGILSEDGFYKVAVNETVVWFQLCDQMIFNHDPPRCFNCQDCGGQILCGTKCSALVANNEGGYSVCTTVGRATNADVDLIDIKNPYKGVTVKMSASGTKSNCSLTVSIFCDTKGVEGPYSLDRSGTCDYATNMRHPSGCAVIISGHGKGWSWFVTLITILLCSLGGYLLAGSVYRYFFLGIRGVEVIPNLDFWLNLPHKLQSLVGSAVRRFRRHGQSSRSSYSPVNF